MDTHSFSHFQEENNYFQTSLYGSWGRLFLCPTPVYIIQSQSGYIYLHGCIWIPQYNQHQHQPTYTIADPSNSVSGPVHHESLSKEKPYRQPDTMQFNRNHKILHK